MTAISINKAIDLATATFDYDYEVLTEAQQFALAVDLQRAFAEGDLEDMGEFSRRIGGADNLDGYTFTLIATTDDCRELAFYAHVVDREDSDTTIDEVTDRGGNTFEYRGDEFTVLDDYEADQAAEEYLDNYIDECVLCDLEGVAAHYFDRESFKRDALLSDGRGHILASYDGNENEVLLDGAPMFLLYQIG